MASSIREEMAKQEKAKKVLQRLSEAPAKAKSVEIINEEKVIAPKAEAPKAKPKSSTKKKTTAQKGK